MRRVHRAKKIDALVDDNDPRGFHALTREFLDSMTLRHCSSATIAGYEACIGYFALWCFERGITQPVDVTRQLCERYQRMLVHFRQPNGRPFGIATQQSRLTAIRAFFKWAARKNHILFNPAADLELPRTPQRVPRVVLTVDEVEAVLAVPDLDTPHGLRDRALMETLYSTGIRRMEAAGLVLNDIDRSRRTVLVREGKGRKDRIVPIGERAVAFIDKYLDEARPFLVVDDNVMALFVNDDGLPFELPNMSYVVNRAVKAANMGKLGSCHLFRHTMATLMLEGGADVRFIQAMLGHTKLSTTEIYTRVSILKLQQIHSSTHPGANFGRHHDADTQQLIDDADARDELLAALDDEDEL